MKDRAIKTPEQRRPARTEDILGKPSARPLTRAIIGLMILLAVSAPALTTISIHLQVMTGSPVNRDIHLIPDIPTNSLVNGNNLVGLLPVPPVHPTNGVGYATVLPWSYTLTVDGWPRAYHIQVLDSTNILDVSSLITNSVSVGAPNIFGLPSVTASNSASVTFTGNGTPTNPLMATATLAGSLGTAAYADTNRFDAAGTAASTATALSNSIAASGQASNALYAVRASSAAIVDNGVTNAVADSNAVVYVASGTVHIGGLPPSGGGSGWTPNNVQSNNINGALTNGQTFYISTNQYLISGCPSNQYNGVMTISKVGTSYLDYTNPSGNHLVYNDQSVGNTWILTPTTNSGIYNYYIDTSFNLSNPLQPFMDINSHISGNYCSAIYVTNTPSGVKSLVIDRPVVVSGFQANVINVDSINGDDSLGMAGNYPFKTINAAVTSTTNSATISINQGFYSETAVIRPNQSVIGNGSNVIVQSIFLASGDYVKNIKVTQQIQAYPNRSAENVVLDSVSSYTGNVDLFVTDFRTNWFFKNCDFRTDGSTGSTIYNGTVVGIEEHWNESISTIGAGTQGYVSGYGGSTGGGVGNLGVCRIYGGTVICTNVSGSSGCIFIQDTNTSYELYGVNLLHNNRVDNPAIFTNFAPRVSITGYYTDNGVPVSLSTNIAKYFVGDGGKLTNVIALDSVHATNADYVNGTLSNSISGSAASATVVTTAALTNSVYATNILSGGTLPMGMLPSNVLTNAAAFDTNGAALSMSNSVFQAITNWDATQDSQYLAATNGTAVNLTISSGNIRGATNYSATNLVGTLPLAQLPAVVLTNGANLTNVFSYFGLNPALLTAAYECPAAPIGATGVPALVGESGCDVFTPFKVYQTRTFTNIWFGFQNGTNTVKVAIYNSSPTNGLPSSLITGLSTNVLSTNGFSLVTNVVSLTLTPGLYYFALCPSNSSGSFNGVGSDYSKIIPSQYTIITSSAILGVAGFPIGATGAASKVSLFCSAFSFSTFPNATFDGQFNAPVNANTYWIYPASIFAQ